MSLDVAQVETAVVSASQETEAPAQASENTEVADSSIFLDSIAEAVEQPSEQTSMETVQEEYELVFSPVMAEYSESSVSEQQSNASVQNSTPQTTQQKISSLKAELQSAKDQQGIIGDVVDGFKNIFNTSNSSRNIEKALNKLDENSTDEEIQAVKDIIEDIIQIRTAP